MNANRLLYSECIRIYGVEEVFIDSLIESGFIRDVSHDEERYIEYDVLSDFEQFVRWYYDMDINIEGIEALYYTLNKVKTLQSEITELKSELNFYKSMLYHDK